MVWYGDPLYWPWWECGRKFFVGQLFWPPIPKTLYAHWWVPTHRGRRSTCVWGEEPPMGWGGAWDRVRVRCSRVAQFRLFCPFPLRFPAGHPFWQPIPKTLYAHWWVPYIGGGGQHAPRVGKPPHGVEWGVGAEFECNVLVWCSF
jgi:hypothetical protein